MKLNTVHHIAVLCSDREAALDFYVRKLGFSVLRDNYRPERDDWKIDLRVNGDTEIELFVVKGRRPRPSPEAYGLRHLAFFVHSVEETVAELAQKGIFCESVRLDSFTGDKMTFFHDPDGLPLEIHERREPIPDPETAG